MLAVGAELDRIGEELGMPRLRFFWFFPECDDSYRARLLEKLRRPAFRIREGALGED